MRLRRWKTGLSDLFLSRWYPLLCALLILLGHCLGGELLFGGILFVSLMLGLWICDDLRFAILPFCGGFFLVSLQHTPSLPAYSSYFTQLPSLIWFGFMIVGLVVSLTAFVVRNRYRAKRLPDRRLFVGMLGLSVALLLNGLLSPNYTLANPVLVLGMIALLLGMYVLFAMFCRFDESAFDYFMYCLVVVGGMLSLQVVFAYATSVEFVQGSVVKESVLFGWGTWTSMGCMLVMLMPAAFYFAYSHRRGWVGILIGCVEFFCAFLTQSRAALLVGGVILLASFVILSFRGSNRRKNRIIALGLLLCALAGGVLLFDRLWGMLSNYLAHGLGDNGRFAIWRTGWEKFLSAPLFGSGFYDSYVDPEWHFSLYPYLYHNTLVQMLASCGVVGLAAYVWHRITTVRLVLRSPNAGKSFLALGVAGLLLFSLLDTIFFNTYPMIFYALMLLFMQKSQHE